MSRSLFLDSLGATISVFLLCGLLKLFVFNIGFMDPVHSALHHVGQEFDNHVHAGTLAPATSFSPTICLVNIGSADRGRIATMLSAIASQQPRVVAVDVVFDKKDEPVNTDLQQTLTQLEREKKLVMASWLAIDGGKGHEKTELYESDAPLRRGEEGYTNFVAEETDGVVRHFLPQYGESAMGRPDTLSFAAQVLRKASPENWKKFQSGLEPDTPVRILYQPDSLRFLRFSESDFTTSSNRLPLLRDAIVLLGSMAGLNDRYLAEDVHRVPTAEEAQLAGLEIHANIIAMLLQQSYMTHIPDGLMWVLSFPLCLLLMMFFIWQFQRHHIYFHLVFKTVQFLLAALVVLVGLCLFRFGQVEINTLPLLVPVALAVDVLYFYESFARWLTNWLPRHRKLAKWIRYKTYFENSHAH